MRICILDEIIEVDAVVDQQFSNQRTDEKPVGAGSDADPLVGERAVAAAHRIHRDDLRAATF